MFISLTLPFHQFLLESIASIADACLSLAAANLINKDKKDYRSKPYYVVAAAIGFAFFLSILFLKETKYSVPESKKLERSNLEEGETPLEGKDQSGNYFICRHRYEFKIRMFYSRHFLFISRCDTRGGVT
jgi:hypothetical protein